MISFKQIKPEEVVAIRHKVLKIGQPVDACYFEGDLEEGTKHFGAFVDNKLIGCATMMLKKTANFKVHPVYRLSGLSVLQENQKQHVGKKLLKFAEDNISKKGSVMIWCFARETALKFYKKNGYQLNIPEVVIPNIGAHKIMFKFVKKED